MAKTRDELEEELLNLAWNTRDWSGLTQEQKNILYERLNNLRAKWQKELETNNEIREGIHSETNLNQRMKDIQENRK